MRLHIARACMGAFMIAAAALPAHAELWRVYLTVEGTQVEATRDTETGLDWLDLRQTADKAGLDVISGPFYAAGFLHATKAQVQDLFAHAQVPDDGYDLRITRPHQAQALIDLLGPLWSGSQGSGTAGITRTLVGGTDLEPGTWTLPPPVFQVGRVEYQDLRASGGGLIGEAHFTGDAMDGEQHDPHVGSFLVRRSDDCHNTGQSTQLNCGVPASPR